MSYLVEASIVLEKGFPHLQQWHGNRTGFSLALCHFICCPGCPSCSAYKNKQTENKNTDAALSTYIISKDSLIHISP